MFSSFQFSSIAQLHLTLCDPMDCSTPGFLYITKSWSLLKLLSIKSVMPSNQLIPCHPLLLPSILCSIRVFSNKSVLPIGGQSIGVSASTSVLPMTIQDWFPLGDDARKLKNNWRKSIKSSYLGTKKKSEIQDKLSFINHLT